LCAVSPGYLKDFLFDEAQARAPVRSLSGGEKARLLLAKLMARPSNLLVLDEPTNDLDVETLDLLQELLDEYDGTVLLVSHDRDFLDRVSTTTVALEGQGRIVVHAGGWSDYAPKRKLAEGPVVKAVAQPKAETGRTGPKSKATGLSFTERHRLDELPALIDRLEAEIGKLEALMSDPDLFTRDPVKFRKASEALADRQGRLTAAEEEWLSLEEKATG
jgi:ATP-binding cassette subfamily F protein uup